MEELCYACAVGVACAAYVFGMLGNAAIAPRSNAIIKLTISTAAIVADMLNMFSPFNAV